jgi:peroxiredoxin
MIARSRLRQFWWPLLLAAVLIAVALAVTQRPPGPRGATSQAEPTGTSGRAFMMGPHIGQLAPNFLLETADGGMVRLSDLRGKPVLVNFWATWCGECRREMPAMQRLAQLHGDAIAVVGVDVGEGTRAVTTWATRLGVSYPLVLDGDKSVSERYTVPAIPTSFFLDADGVIRSLAFGELTFDQMETNVLPLLAGQT